MSESLAKIGDVVPSAYYDLIARIVPGVAVVAIASYLLAFTPNMEPGERIAAVIGAAYIVGLLLSAVSTMILLAITTLPKWLQNKFPRLPAVTTLSKLAEYSDASFWSRIHAHSKDREASALLAKMAAESTCVENLVVAVLAITWVDPDRSQHVGILVAAFILTVLAAIQRRMVLGYRLQNS